MSKYLYLIKNIGVLTLSNLGSKILAFLLIPLYTSVLSTEQYGVFDLAQTTVSLCIPILSINISSAALRLKIKRMYLALVFCTYYLLLSYFRAPLSAINM